MSDCGCEAGEASDRGKRRALRIALALNAGMFVVGMTAGILARSTGLAADALDMLADAGGYAIALMAVSRGTGFKFRAAVFNACVIGLLGLLVILEAVAHWTGGRTPLGGVMIGVACLSLAVNLTVLVRILGPFRHGEAHLRAAWLCTRADVLANLGVIVSGALVLILHSRLPDLVIGIAVGLVVLHEAGEALREARSADASGRG